MTTLSQAVATRNFKPEALVVLPPAAFADDWPKKAGVDVCIGLRRLSQADISTARGEAERVATGFYDHLRGMPRAVDPETLADIRNDELLIVAIGRAATDPNDIRVPYFPGQEDQARHALTEKGLRRIWDELVRLTVSGNVARPRASDAEAMALGRALASGKYVLTDELRMLAACLIEDLEIDTSEPEPEPDDGEEPETIYVVRAAAERLGEAP